MVGTGPIGKPDRALWKRDLLRGVRDAVPGEADTHRTAPLAYPGLGLALGHG